MRTSQTYIHMTGDEIDQIFIEMLFYYSKILSKQSCKQVFFFFDRNEKKKDVKEKEKEEKKEGQVKLHIINLYAHRLLI